MAYFRPFFAFHFASPHDLCQGSNVLAFRRSWIRWPSRKAVLSTAAALDPRQGHSCRRYVKSPRDAKRAICGREGTQTVFGEGKSKAQIMLVGEQPGNDEDLAGQPFVGPAGKLLTRRSKRRESIADWRMSPTS